VLIYIQFQTILWLEKLASIPANLQKQRKSPMGFFGVHSGFSKFESQWALNQLYYQKFFRL